MQQQVIALKKPGRTPERIKVKTTVYNCLQRGNLWTPSCGLDSGRRKFATQRRPFASLCRLWTGAFRRMVMKTERSLLSMVEVPTRGRIENVEACAVSLLVVKPELSLRSKIEIPSRGRIEESRFCAVSPHLASSWLLAVGFQSRTVTSCKSVRSVKGQARRRKKKYSLPTHHFQSVVSQRRARPNSQE